MQELKKKMWAVGGGKGGVGKSVVTLMLGVSLARQGRKVILVDADLGGSNLHTLAGIKYPPHTLEDFLNREKESIEDIVLDTPVENLQLICGADDILGLANPKYAQKIRLFNHLKRLDADYILLDLGAGISYTTMDFFLYAPNKIVVLTPQATSIQNAYGFIKASLYRGLSRMFSKDPQSLDLIKRASSGREKENIESVEKLRESFSSLGQEKERMLSDFLQEMNIHLIVNMVRTTKEKEVGNIVTAVARNYLSLNLSMLGIAQYDEVLATSINSMGRFLTEKKDSIAGICSHDIAQSVINITSNSDNHFPSSAFDSVVHSAQSNTPLSSGVGT
jgi:flagellar biosynthesis protein FlhG